MTFETGFWQSLRVCQVKLSEGSSRLKGFVRVTGRELVDRVRSRLSRGELTPFSKRGGTVDFEVFAAVKMTFLDEMNVD